MIWGNSKYYCCSERMVVLMKQIANMLIESAERSLDPGSIFQGEPDETSIKIIKVIRIFENFLANFEYVRNNLVNYFPKKETSDVKRGSMKQKGKGKEKGKEKDKGKDKGKGKDKDKKKTKSKGSGKVRTSKVHFICIFIYKFILRFLNLRMLKMKRSLSPKVGIFIEESYFNDCLI